MSTRSSGAAARRRSRHAPWRVPADGVGRTGRIVLHGAFMTELARSLTNHLATTDEVDRLARRRVDDLDLDRLVVHGDLEGVVRRTARDAVEDHAGTRRLPALMSRDLAYVIDAHRRAVNLDGDRAFGDRAADALVRSLPAGTSATTRRRVRALVRGLEPRSLPTTPRRPRSGTDRPSSPTTGGGRANLGAVRLDSRWGGSQAPFSQVITPFLRERGLAAGSQKRSHVPAGGSPTSDHLVGNRNAYATDYPTMSGLDDAQALARHLGIEGWRANSYQSFNLRIGGEPFRIQILWGAGIGHGDHVHVGLRAG